MASEAAAKIDSGKLIDKGVELKINPKIEKGILHSVNALVVHQTGAGTAKSSLSSYDNGSNGAHFLIDRDGTIYQTARTDRICWHVGKVLSRCYALKSCTADELKNVKSILFNKADSYSARVSKLHEHESKKGYPDRYPTNNDSLGIELVAKYLETTGYEEATKEQNASLAWLVSTLTSLLTLDQGDIYRHPEVSYKQKSEASSAAW